MSLLLAIIVSATLDSAYITIGDQTGLHLEATCAKTEQVGFPHLGERLIDGIEIVSRTPVDSTIDNQGKHYSQTLMLTSFQDSLFFVEPLPFAAGSDTFYSESLTINVIQPFQLDSTTAITDIKPIMTVSYPWWMIALWILGILLLAGIGWLIWWLTGKIGRYQGHYTPVMPEAPKRPAEEVALEELDRIREEKLWAQGQTKQYHTELTDVLRTYISSRFSVASTEKTSDETLRALKPLLSDRRDLHQQLTNVLQQADLVKFAKWHTTPDEDEQALNTAYTFVKETTNQPT